MASRLPMRPALLSFSLVAVLVSAVQMGYGQSRLDGGGVGRAGASAASSRGLATIYSNPGCIDLDPVVDGEGSREIAFSVYNVGGVLGSTFLNSSDFDQIFGAGGGWPNADDRRRLGGLLRGDRLVGIAANSVIAARWPTDIGTFGFHYAHRIFSRLDFPSDFTTILVDNELFNQRYEFVNNGVGGDWITQFGLTYGTSVASNTSWFPSIGLGATIKVIRGIAHFEVGENSILTVDRTTTGGGIGYRVRGGYSVRSALPDGFDAGNTVSGFLGGLFPAGAGVGVGVDVGIGGVLYQTPRGKNGEREQVAYFGIALSDLGSVRWNTNTTLRHQEQIDDLIPNATLTNEQFSKYQGELDTIDAFSTGLPSLIRAGIAFDGHSFGVGPEGLPMIIEVCGELPLNDAPGNESSPKAALGATVGVTNNVVLRTGISGGGIDGFGVGLGVGIRPVDWLSIDLGSAEVDGMIAGDRVDLTLQVIVGLGER